MAENANHFPRRLLWTFDLNDIIVNKLQSNGFTIKSEIDIISDSNLKRICGLNDQQLDEINRVVRNSDKKVIKVDSVYDLVRGGPHIIHTGSYSLDYVMNGGLQVSKITQISSESGGGKTQICMQCCVNVQLPPKYGGLSGSALYIDTENSFRPERIVSMAEHRLSSHPDLKPSLSPEIIKSRIHLITCTTNSDDFIDLILNRIDPFIEQNPEIRLVVIDSIAQHFRYDYKSTDTQREYELSQITYKLRVMAHSRKVAILITNQVSYNPKFDRTLPTLGKLWNMNLNIALIFCKLVIPLFGGGEKVMRKGYVIRGDTDLKHSFYFGVTENGIIEMMHDPDGDWHPQY